MGRAIPVQGADVERGARPASEGVRSCCRSGDDEAVLDRIDERVRGEPGETGSVPTSGVFHRLSYASEGVVPVASKPTVAWFSVVADDGNRQRSDGSVSVFVFKRPDVDILRTWDGLVERTPGTDVTQLSAWAHVRAMWNFSPCTCSPIAPVSSSAARRS